MRGVVAAARHHGECIGERRAGELGGQMLPQLAYIIAGNGGVEGAHVTFRFGGELPAQSRFLFQAVEVEPLARRRLLREQGQGDGGDQPDTKAGTGAHNPKFNATRLAASAARASAVSEGRRRPAEGRRWRPSGKALRLL